MTVGRISRVPLRDVWPNEALNFTPWLQQNLDVLNEVLELDLTSAEREQSAGSFSLDLLAEDSAGNPVIIENQLERSDHDHLGKVLTYLVAFDASIAIWIVKEPRPEHIAAIQWLNEASSGSFYLVQLEAIRIDDSPPAPILTKIVGPTEEARQVGQTKREFSERHELRYRFWDTLLNYARSHTDVHANISPGKENWISAGSGISNVTFAYVVLEHSARVEFYISKSTEEQNKAIYDGLAVHQNDINIAFGDSLSWERRDENVSSKIAYYVEHSGYRDEHWDELIAILVDAMIRLEAALRPYINQLEI